MLKTTKTENKIAFGIAEIAELASVSAAMLA